MLMQKIDRGAISVSEKCVACGGPCKPFCHLPAKITDFYSTSICDINYIQCLSCGTIQQTPLPTSKDLEAMVASEYSDTTDKLDHARELTLSTKPHHQLIVEQLRNNFIKENVLEVGTGVGNLLEMVLANGIEAIGIELSPQLAAYARDRGLPVEECDLNSIGRRNFSAVLMSHVFEHLCDPEHILQEIHSVLLPNGLFISAQPTAAMTNFLSRLFRLNRLESESPVGIAYLNLNPWHIAIYSIEGMKTIALRNGFEVIHVQPLPSVHSKGVIGLIRKIYHSINSFGEVIFPERWPFHVAHLFVLRKV